MGRKHTKSLTDSLPNASSPEERVESSNYERRDDSAGTSTRTPGERKDERKIVSFVQDTDEFESTSQSDKKRLTRNDKNDSKTVRDPTWSVVVSKKDKRETKRTANLNTKNKRVVHEVSHNFVNNLVLN
jgi:hypothetical protein